jgi:serine/threonine-protein phosphatase 6 catalytic subunit
MQPERVSGSVVRVCVSRAHHTTHGAHRSPPPTGLELICRAHQLVQEGLKYMFPDQSLVTVWSAPNYCYRCGNVASILIFDDSLQRDVRYFTETSENSTMMAPRAPSRYFW